MGNWQNRDKKIKNRRAFKKQGRMGYGGIEPSSDQRKREIKKKQRHHRKNIWHEEIFEEDEMHR